MQNFQHSHIVQGLLPYSTAGNILYVVLVLVIDFPICWALYTTGLYMMFARKYRGRERKRMVR